MDEKTNPRKGMSQAEYEDECRAFKVQLMGEMMTIIKWDHEMNQHISDLAAEMVRQIKANPKLLQSRAALLTDIQGSEVSGGDIVGGDVADEIWHVIKDILTGEKDFVKEIINKILGF